MATMRAPSVSLRAPLAATTVVSLTSGFKERESRYRSARKSRCTREPIRVRVMFVVMQKFSFLFIHTYNRVFRKIF